MLQALKVFAGMTGVTDRNEILSAESTMTPEPEITREGAWQAFLNLRESAKRNGLQDFTC